MDWGECHAWNYLRTVRATLLVDTSIHSIAGRDESAAKKPQRIEASKVRGKEVGMGEAGGERRKETHQEGDIRGRRHTRKETHEEGNTRGQGR